MSSDGIRLAWMARLSDGLMLCSSAEPMTQSNEDRALKTQMKQIISSLQRKRPEQETCVVPLGPAYVMYGASASVIFMGLFDKSYSQQFAQSFLAELRKEFSTLYADARVAAVQAPFGLMEFETFVEKSRKAFLQSSTQRSIDKISGNLNEIHRVMTKSLSDVVSRGDDLSVLSSKSDLVLMESEQYRKASVDLNRAKWLQKYGVLVAILLLITGLFWLRVRYVTN